MSEPQPTQPETSDRRRRRAFPIAVGVTAILVLVIVVEPTGIVRGRIVGEEFYRGRPSSYWARQLTGGPAEQAAAREALLDGGEDAAPILAGLLESGDLAETRWTAAELLGELGPNAHAAHEALLVALHDDHPHVQSVAAEVIPKIDTPADKAVPALAALLDGEHSAVAARAISVYKAQGAPAIPQLLDVLTDTSRSVDDRWNAARTIGKIGPPAVDTVPVLIEMTRDSEATVRGNAAEAIGDIGPTAAAGVPALIDVLDDTAHRVRHHAVRSLGYIGVDAKAAVPHIKLLLKDPEDSVREEAVKALKAIAPDELPGDDNADAESTDQVNDGEP